MHKFRTALLLVLVAAVIMGCGALPGIAASIADGINQNVPGVAPMNAISFTASVPETDTMQYYLDRLALYGNMYSVPMNTASARMTEEEVLAAARAQMGAYEHLGVLQPFEKYSTYAEPQFAIACNDVENTAVYWTVYSSSEKNADRLLVYLDDATGKIFSIDFERAEGLYADCTVAEYRTLMERLATVFLGQFAPEEETLTSRVYEVNEVEINDYGASYEYVLSGYEEDQTRYVSVRIQLYPYGFLITCSNNMMRA